MQSEAAQLWAVRIYAIVRHVYVMTIIQTECHLETP